MIRPPKVDDAIAAEPDGTQTGRYGDYTLHSAYQPIVRRRGDRLVLTAFEALIRPQLHGEETSPADLFARADRSDRLFVESLCRALHIRNYALVRPQGRYLFLNINPASYTDVAVVEREFNYLLAALPDFALTPDRIICDIVETDTQDIDMLQHLVAKLMECGFQVSLDDFGRRSSNFERYTALKPGIVKIDRDYFIAVIAQPSERRLLNAAMETFNRHGTRVLVEGIETREELDHAKALGVSLFQGFGIARPQKPPMDIPLSFALPQETGDTGLIESGMPEKRRAE